MNTSLDRIVAEIRKTNNGKLMLRNLPISDREAVPALVACGSLEYARFIDASDAVCVAGHGAKYGMPIAQGMRKHCASQTWIDGPDYEALIMARQEADGYYD